MRRPPRNDYRYFSARSSSRNRQLMGRELQEWRSKEVQSLGLQIGDSICYDFGDKILVLKIVDLEPNWIYAVDEKNRKFRFGGVEGYAPGVWDGNFTSVSTLIRRPHTQTVANPV